MKTTIKAAIMTLHVIIMSTLLISSLVKAALNPNLQLLAHLKANPGGDQFLVLMETGQLYPEPLKAPGGNQIIDQNQSTKYYARLRVLNIKQNLYVKLIEQSPALPIGTSLYSLQAVASDLNQAKNSLATLAQKSMSVAANKLPASLPPVVLNYLRKIQPGDLNKTLALSLEETNWHMRLGDNAPGHQFLRPLDSDRMVHFNPSLEEQLNPLYQEGGTQISQFFFPFTLHLGLYKHSPLKSTPKLGCLNPADEKNAWAMKFTLSFTPTPLSDGDYDEVSRANKIFDRILQDDKQAGKRAVQIPAGRGCVTGYHIERIHLLSNMDSPTQINNPLIVAIIKTTLSSPKGSKIPNESYMVVSGELNGQP